MTYPHLRPGRTAELALHAPNAALLIDFDNVTLGIQSDLTKELRTLLNSDIIKGKVAVQRAYADWRRYPQYIAPLSASSIDLIFAPAFGSVKKNATDIRLAIDAIELVFTRPEIGTFIIMSGDSDFSTMVIKLKEYGKYVIGVGIRESASDLLIQNCDEYFSYNDLAGLTREAEPGTSTRDPWELAQEAVAQMARNGDVMRSDRLKQVMQQIDRNFDEKNAGFSRFSKFVMEAGQKGKLQVTKLDNGQFEVAPAGSAPAAAAPRDGRVGERRSGRDGAEGREGQEGARRGRGRGRGGRRGETAERPAAAAGNGAAAEAAPAKPAGLSLARAFQLMSDALSEFRGPVAQGPLRLRMVAMHGREDPLLEESRFGRLLRQANDAEVADVRQVGDDDFEVTGRRRPDARAAQSPRAPAGERAAAERGHTERAHAEPASTESQAEAAAGTGAAPSPAKAPAASAPEARDAGPRMGVRFRRGSRGPAHTREIPLIGVVRSEAQAAAASQEAAAPPEAEVTAKERPRRPRAKSAKTAKTAEGPKAAKRPSRAKAAKKAE